MLSQALRRLQRPTVPMPGFAVGGVGSALRSARLADFSPEQLAFLTYGRGVDTTRMRERARLRAGVHHRGGVRGLRRRADPDRRLHRPGARRASSSSVTADRPASLRERSMGDAEIIPIGTRGRPGRGTGTQDLVAVAQPRTRRAASPTRPTPTTSRPAAPTAEDDRRRSAKAKPTSPGRSAKPSDRGDRPRPRPARTEDADARAPASRSATGWPRSSTPPRRSSATSGSRSSPSSWRSCAAGSPATTRSTSSASTRRSPSGSS